MSVDNNPGAGPDIKREDIDPPHTNCCGSGEFMPPTHSSATAQDCKPSMPSFEPRQFPPPSLAGVPYEYIVDQLRNLAPNYWDKPETADCTIVVPVPHLQGRPIHPSLTEHFPPQTHTSVASMYDPSGLGRRATEPSLNFVPRISLKLHVDYLSAHSTYIRALFSGANPLDLVHTTSTAFNGPTSAGRFKIPENRLPRLMPCSSADHPVLYLPVPDPLSFHLLVHWMYFGDTNPIEDCLHEGTIQWEGIARNVEYLGLSREIKIFLGNWYSHWLHPELAREDDDELDDDDDTVYSDYDDMDYDSSTASVVDDSDMESEDEKDFCRGRSRVPRPLSYQPPGTRIYGA